MASIDEVVNKKEETTPVTTVKITSKSHVKPNKPLGRKECQLVTFDLPYLAFYYNQKLLVYSDSISSDGFKDKVENLKDGLRVVLEEFYQLAGRLGKDEEGVFRVEYDDEMDGVEVVEAVADGISVEDLTAEEDVDSFKELIPYNKVLNLEGIHRPLLAVQLTKLKNGIAMGLAFNHAILDGTSTWHFMSSWAQICSGTPSISSTPFLDRTKSRNTRVKLDLTAPDPIATTNGAPNTAEKETSPPPPPQLRVKVFKFTEASVDKIKSTVNSSTASEGSTPFSTFQSLSVHIWRHVTKARELKPEDITVFTVFADCRKRVDPPMPEAYFGNLIQAIFTGTAAGLLLAHAPAFGASVIQKAIVAHDAKAIDERNTEWEKAPKIFQFKDAGVNCVAIGSSPRFKVYDIDFGSGKPETVRGGSNNRFDGMVYLYPGKSGGRSIDVELCLEAKAMEILENEKEFVEV